MAERTTAWIWALGALSAALVLQACREDEQGRPLLYDKGTYLGEADRPLEERQVEQLRYRAQNQKF